MVMYTYNGHAKKDMRYRNDMTNFGILMEINGIDNPFTWSRKLVKECQIAKTKDYIIHHLVPFQPHQKVKSS
jgi:hypothetical protein